MKNIFVKIISVMCSVVLFAGLMSGCSEGIEKAPDENSSEEIIIEQSIVFIYQNINFAWGYYNSGWFINSSGNIIGYDFSDKGADYYSSTAEFIARLEELNTDTSGRSVDIERLKKNYQRLYNVNLNAEIESEHVACDMGQFTYYGVVYGKNNEPKLVLLSAKGDIEYTNTDKNAKKIGRWLEKI